MCFWRCCSGGKLRNHLEKTCSQPSSLFLYGIAPMEFNTAYNYGTFPNSPYPACTFFHEVVFTRYYFSTYLAGVPSEQSRAENVTSECRPLIGRREEEERETRGWLTRATPSQKSDPAFLRNLGTTATVRFPTETWWWLSTWTVLDWFVFWTNLHCFLSFIYKRKSIYNW